MVTKSTNVPEIAENAYQSSVSLYTAKVNGLFYSNEVILVYHKYEREYKVATVVGGDTIVYLYPYIIYDKMEKVGDKYTFIRKLDKEEYVTITGAAYNRI